MRRLLLSTFAVFSTLASFAHADETGDATRNVIRVGVAHDVSTFDWNMAIDAPSTWVLSHLTRRLFRVDDQGDVVPDLAKTFVPKGTRTRIQIVEGVKWSDGQPLQAQHFVDSLQRILDPANKSPAATFLIHMAGAKTIDSKTFEIEWKVPLVGADALLSHSCLAPIRKDLILKHGPAWTKPEHYVSLGPYRLATHKLESKITLEPISNEAMPIELRILQDPVTAETMFRAGKLDIVYGTSFSTSRAPDSQLKLEPVERATGLLLKETFLDQKTRQAFFASIDRNEVVKALGAGRVPIKNWIPNHYGIKSLDKSNSWQKLSPFRAKLSFSQREDHVIVAQVIQHRLKSKGIELELEPLELKTFLQRMKLGELDIALVSFGSGYPDISGWLAPFIKDGSYSSMLSGTAFTDLARKIEIERNPKKRKALVSDAQSDLLHQRAVLFPLYSETNSLLVKPRIDRMKFENGRLKLDSLRVSGAAKAL